MLEKPYNHQLCYRLVVTPREAAELWAKLPAAVGAALQQDLDTSGEAETYDLATQTAYALRKLGTGVARWSWADVRTNGEAGRLLASVINLDEPLNPLLACQLYTAATKRPSVLDPEHMPRDGAP